MLRVANAKPERVDLSDNTLDPDDAARCAFGLLVLGNVGNLDYGKALTGSVRIILEPGR